MSFQIIKGQERCPLEEKITLGALMLDSSCAAEILGILQPEDFVLDKNQEIYETICDMIHSAEAVNPATVLEKMKLRGCCREDSLDYILQLVDVTPIGAEAVTCASRLRERAEHRRSVVAQLREELKNGTLLSEITKGAVIPVAKSDVEMMEALICQKENDETLPFEECDDD